MLKTFKQLVLVLETFMPMTEANKKNVALN